MTDLEVKDALDLPSNVVVPYDGKFQQVTPKKKKKQEDEF